MKPDELLESKVEALRQRDKDAAAAVRASLQAQRQTIDQKLAGIERQLADRSNETADELLDRHAKRKGDDGLKFARRALTGKKRKSDAAKASAAGCILVAIQAHWISKKKPMGGVSIPLNKLSTWLRKGGWGDSYSSVRDSVAKCKAAGVLSVRKAGQRSRYYLPVIPIELQVNED